MPNPFPGIDPYLEAQRYWSDFHTVFNVACLRTIGLILPAHYEARVDERVRLLDTTEDGSRDIKPDVAIVARLRPPVERGGGGVAVLEEVELEPVEVPNRNLLEIRERFLKILHREDRSLVTVIELLSPENKSRRDRNQYLSRRNNLLGRPIHLVELDFLAGGPRPPLAEPLPPGDAYAIVSRSERRPVAEVYAWSVRRRLPKVRLPLRSPDPDIILDLAALYATTYEWGLYDRSIARSKPLKIALNAEDRAWAEALAGPAAG